MHLSVAYDFLPRRASVNASIVMDHFGVGFETGRHVIAEDLELPIEPGDVVCFSGASGSGKSSLLRAVVAELRRIAGPATRAGTAETESGASPCILDVNALPLDDRLLIDALELPSGEAMRLLSACGLGEAQLMLRTADELSDGQRYRFRLALAAARLAGRAARAGRAGRAGARWIVADEFTATLDRTLAKVIAYNVRRLADRTGIGVLAATTHEDILEDLAPTLHVVCGLDGRIEWRRSEAGEAFPGGALPGGAWERECAKKKRSALRGGCSSRAAPAVTGRTFLGGIIAGTACPPCGS